MRGFWGVVLFSWISWPAEKKPTEPKTKKVSSSEIMKCSELIKTSATNPSTVVLHELAGTSSDRKGSGGTSRVKMDFEAKKAFGIQVEYQAVCQFAKGVPSIQIFNR